jgi:hypothetical protein
MIKAKYGSFDGNSWEEFCQVCLKLKYESEGYQELPAWQGDLGIEGFTRTGKAFQCYCPDEDYEPQTLYEKQREKITTDLGKLRKNELELKKYMNGILIQQWIFLTPMYKNKELVKHCQTKASDFRNMNLDILSESFDVLIYDIDFFAAQIQIVKGTTNNKLEILADRDESKDINWKGTNIDLVNNAVTKHGKRIPDSPNKEEKINKLTDFTIGDFLDEQQLVTKWKNLNPNDYEKFLRLISDYEKTVEEMCIINTDDNNHLYERIKQELKERLKQTFPYIEDITLEKLMKGVVADWILRCPINFE